MTAPANHNDRECIDLAVLEKLQISMKDRFPLVIRTFIASSEGMIARIDGAVAANDATSLREAAHSLKSAGQMGAKELYRLAAELEEFGKQGETAGTDELVAALKQEFVAVSLKLQSSMFASGGA